MEISAEQRDAANRNIPLFELASHDTTLKRAGRNDYQGACPFCGGRDRFYIQPENRRWGCRNCAEKYHDALAYVMRRDSLTFLDAVNRYSDAPQTVAPRNRPAPQPAPAPQPVKFPAVDTQETLRAIVQQGRDNLRRSDVAQRYLEQRGILDSADRFQLGYSPEFQVGDIHVPAGIMFPHKIGGRIWAVKIRRLPDFTKTCYKCQRVLALGETCECKQTKNPKNLFIWRERAETPVNKPALYNADALLNADTALVCEGEIDCITLAQELGLPVVTLGGVGNSLDVALWGMYTMSLRRVFVVKDNDVAGQNLRWAAELFGAKAVDAKLPDSAKDPNELYLAGGLYAWAAAAFLTPQQQETFAVTQNMTQTWQTLPTRAGRLAWLQATDTRPAQQPAAGVALYNVACLRCNMYAKNPACRACKF